MVSFGLADKPLYAMVTIADIWLFDGGKLLSGFGAASHPNTGRRNATIFSLMWLSIPAHSYQIEGRV